jgi:phage terminase large subunit-like protein
LRSAFSTSRSGAARDDLVAALEGLTAGELRRILDDWQIWARDDQLPPPATAVGALWSTWLVLGGRGAGKTRAGAEWVRAQALGLPPLAEAPVGRIALVGETRHDVRSVMIEGISGLLGLPGARDRPAFEPSKQRLIWPNGAIAQIFSAEDPDSLRGPQFAAAWCDELAKWRHAEETWDMLQLGLRLGSHPRQVVTTTPRPVPLLKRLLERPGHGHDAGEHRGECRQPRPELSGRDAPALRRQRARPAGAGRGAD